MLRKSDAAKLRVTVAAHRQPEPVAGFIAVARGMEAVGHAAPYLQPAHGGQGTLGVRPAREQEAQPQRENEYRPFHIT